MSDTCSSLYSNPGLLVPKLVSQLYEESIFTNIGGVQFRIPRDLFSGPGNSPNFFTLGFAHFFSPPGGEVFPGLDREGLLRPPSIVPPSVEGRSPEIFSELLHLLRGYPIEIRSEQHRAQLLRDCRYFNLKGLEQRLIPHALSFNQARGRSEIVLRLGDILKSGISVAGEPTPADPLAGWVNYARPYVDDRASELVLEIGGESTRLRLGPDPTTEYGIGSGTVIEARAEFFGEMRARVTKLLEVISTKLNLAPATQQPGTLTAPGRSTASLSPGNTLLSEDLVKVVLDSDTSVVLDGKPWTPSPVEGEDLSWMTADVDNTLLPRKRRRVDGQGGGDGEEWIVKTGQWRLKIQSSQNGKAAVECCFVAVKLDAYSSERARNAQRPFLGG